MRVIVDFDVCESNAVCMQFAPDVFEVRDDDFLYVLKEDVTGHDETTAAEAARRCPRQAITLQP